ncbi:hypothetical protein BV20DRAFT_1057992 [Pilatotrama ljubarskyi]|nr:hypothetical protein BV20DRAFT_1057992 [Pilatotrama ljubarskyi]
MNPGNRHPRIPGSSASACGRRPRRPDARGGRSSAPFASPSSEPPVRLSPGSPTPFDLGVPFRVRRPPPRPVAKNSVRSAAHWDEQTGDVVVRAADVLYRLPSSALKEHCVFFARDFEADVEAGGENSVKPEERPRVDECPVYDVPDKVSPTDFELLLAVLGVGRPEKDVRLLSVEEAGTLLRVARALSSNRGQSLAEERLSTLWDGRKLPRAESYLTTNIASAAHALSTPNEPPSTSFADALVALRIARELKLPTVLKRAAYELIANDDFWYVLRVDPVGMDVDGAELPRLLQARRELHVGWRKAVTTPPMNVNAQQIGHRHHQRGSGGVTSTCHYWLSRTGIVRCKRTSGPKRVAAWEELMDSVGEHGAIRDGERDPMRYDVFRHASKALVERWCSCCKRQWERALLEKRTEWWARLDHVLQPDPAFDF